jgi:hypothetical protein
MKNLDLDDIGKQVTNCNASKNSSWRTRAATHKENLLAILRARGASGVLSSELYDCPQKFGRSPRNRLSELRRLDGFSIQTVHVDTLIVRYVLLADHGEQPATDKPHVAGVVDKSTTPDSLPLFAGVDR